MQEVSQKVNVNCKFPIDGAAMTNDPDMEIRRLFARAALQNEVARGLSGDGWAAYQKIHTDHAAETRLLERDFLADYQNRFEAARRRIVDEIGSKDRTLAPRWFGRDKFDAALIDRQADREVRLAHDASLEHLRQQKESAINSLFDPGKKHRERREKVIIDFTRAADRRSGQDRPPGPSR